MGSLVQAHPEAQKRGYVKIRHILVSFSLEFHSHTTQYSIEDDAELYSISRSTLLTNRVLRHDPHISAPQKYYFYAGKK